jgi:hypothetical protein
LDALGFSLKGTNKYTYGVSTADASSFTTVAEGKTGSITGDKWSMDEGGVLTDMDPNSFSN